MVSFLFSEKILKDNDERKKSKLLINGEEIVDNWTDPKPGDAFFAFGTESMRGDAHLEKGKKYQIEIQYKFEGNFPAIYMLSDGAYL